jgi:hypothetical protein
MVLWLTAMHCYHVAEGKPENLTRDEETKFRAAITSSEALSFVHCIASMRKTTYLTHLANCYGMH